MKSFIKLKWNIDNYFRNIIELSIKVDSLKYMWINGSCSTFIEISINIFKDVIEIFHKFFLQQIIKYILSFRWKLKIKISIRHLRQLYWFGWSNDFQKILCYRNFNSFRILPKKKTSPFSINVVIEKCTAKIRVHF